MKTLRLIIFWPGLLLGLFLVATWSSEARAWETYSLDIGATGNCATCHGAFRGPDYVSDKDGPWGKGNDLHGVHTGMGTPGCGTCHWGVGTDGREVALNSSQGGTGLVTIACIGCHGRAEDRGDTPADCADPDNTYIGEVCGDGAGLRRHHHNAGQTSCASCHSDADPADLFVPVGEDLLPPYYGIGTLPTNPCNLDGNEDFAGQTPGLGLDNDGDLAYDALDVLDVPPDCGPTPTPATPTPATPTPATPTPATPTPATPTPATPTPTASPTPTPEPGALLQLVAGGIGLAFLDKRRARRRRRAKPTS